MEPKVEVKADRTPRHRDCGGEIEQHPTLGYWFTDPDDIAEFGEFVPGFYCVKCGEEILGDAMIVWDPFGLGEDLT